MSVPWISTNLCWTRESLGVSASGAIFQASFDGLRRDQATFSESDRMNCRARLFSKLLEPKEGPSYFSDVDGLKHRVGKGLGETMLGRGPIVTGAIRARTACYDQQVDSASRAPSRASAGHLVVVSLGASSVTCCNEHCRHSVDGKEDRSWLHDEKSVDGRMSH